MKYYFLLQDFTVRIKKNMVFLMVWTISKTQISPSGLFILLVPHQDKHGISDGLDNQQNSNKPARIIHPVGATSSRVLPTSFWLSNLVQFLVMQ